MLESRHFSATGYLFIYAAFYYAFVSSACTRRLSPLPLPSIPAVGSIANSLLIFFFFVKKKFKRKKFRFDTWTCWFEKDLIESFVRLVAFCFTHSGVECEFWMFEFVYNLIRQILRIKLKLKFWEFIRELTIFLPLPVRLQ